MPFLKAVDSPMLTDMERETVYSEYYFFFNMVIHYYAGGTSWAWLVPHPQCRSGGSAVEV